MDIAYSPTRHGNWTGQEDLHRLIYVSRNDVRGSLPEIEWEVFRILELSRVNNARDGISGALLFSESCFAQVLEGGAAALAETFERIQQDRRHSGTVVLEHGPAPAREFGGWSMAYAGPVAAAEARYGALIADASKVEASARIMATLRGAVVRADADSAS